MVGTFDDFYFEISKEYGWYICDDFTQPKHHKYETLQKGYLSTLEIGT